MILAFDTSTSILSVALLKGDKLYHKKDTRPFGHAEKLMPLIDEILGETDSNIQDVETILVSLGPGSFTGIRIGIATALGLEVSLGCQVFGISSLDARLPEVEEGVRMAIIDARRERVYVKVRGAYHMKEENLPFREVLEKVSEVNTPVKIHCENKEPFFSIAKEVLGEHLAWDDNTDYALGMIRAYQEDLYTKNVEPMYLRMTQAEAEKKGLHLD